MPECEHIFTRMILNCKISKFHKVNYKILARILATPKITAKVRGQENIAWCAWCGYLGTLEHILLHCKETKNLRHLVCSKIFKQKLSARYWIFGVDRAEWNQVIWLTNFVIYKSHLCACDNSQVDMISLLEMDAMRFSPIYSVLNKFKSFSVL